MAISASRGANQAPGFFFSQMGVAVSDKPTRMMPDFLDEPARQAWFTAHADYFTVVRKVGLSYERHERPTLAEAKALGQQLADHIHKPYLIYAVVGSADSWVCNVVPQ